MATGQYFMPATESKVITEHKRGASLKDLHPFKRVCGNDPSAGSPTETLLRLHLPLNDEV